MGSPDPLALRRQLATARLTAAIALAHQKGRADLTFQAQTLRRVVRFASLGELGPNGLGPAIDDTCRTIAEAATMAEVRARRDAILNRKDAA